LQGNKTFLASGNPFHSDLLAFSHIPVASSRAQHMSSTSEDDVNQDRDGRSTLLLFAKADATEKWKCTNGNGVPVSSGFVEKCMDSFDTFFDVELKELISDYLAQPALEMW
jgi:hypothetical protein